MSDLPWKNIETAPANKTVMTKLDDNKGIRNEQALYRSGSLWWTPDGEMYVYYTPTHWREMTATERRAELDLLTKKAASDQRRSNLATSRLQP